MKHCIFFLSAFLGLSCSTRIADREAPWVNEIPRNTQFIIKLPEDHTQGYNWQLSQDYDPSVIRQINEVWHGNEKGIYFNLKTLSKGETTLFFIKRKYTDTLDTKRFTIRITK